jgi:hypothetical protein
MNYWHLSPRNVNCFNIFRKFPAAEVTAVLYRAIVVIHFSVFWCLNSLLTFR